MSARVLVVRPGEAPEVQEWPEITTDRIRAAAGDPFGTAFRIPLRQWIGIDAFGDDESYLRVPQPAVNMVRWDGWPLRGPIVLMTYVGDRHRGMTPAELDFATAVVGWLRGERGAPTPPVTPASPVPGGDQ